MILYLFLLWGSITSRQCTFPAIVWKIIIVAYNQVQSCSALSSSQQLREQLNRDTKRNVMNTTERARRIFETAVTAGQIQSKTGKNYIVTRVSADNIKVGAEAYKPYSVSIQELSRALKDFAQDCNVKQLTNGGFGSNSNALWALMQLDQ